MPTNDLPYTWYEFQKALIAPGYKETKALNSLASRVLSHVSATQKVFSLDRIIRLFRARVGGPAMLPGHPPYFPYSGAEISAPPAEKAASGRFNAEGVPFLYLSTSEEVALAETRPMPNERCSVACFKVDIGLKLINLIPEHNPHSAGSKPLELDSFWNLLCQNAAQQYSSKDVAQEYRSLQFIASVFQEEGYDGVVYRSAFFEDHWRNDREPWGGGTFYNYVLFDPRKASFESSRLKILKRSLKSDLVNSP